MTGAGDTTRLALTYYFFADPTCGGKGAPACQLRVGYVQSNDGGAHWSNPQTLAGPFPVTWTPDTSQGRMVGDYISTSWVNGRAFGAFAVATAPTGSTFHQNISIPQGGVLEHGPVPERAGEGAVVLRQRRDDTPTLTR